MQDLQWSIFTLVFLLKRSLYTFWPCSLQYSISEKLWSNLGWGPLLLFMCLTICRCSSGLIQTWSVIVTGRQQPIMHLPSWIDKSCRFNQWWCSHETPALTANLPLHSTAGTSPRAKWRFTQQKITWRLEVLLLPSDPVIACWVNNVCSPVLMWIDGWGLLIQGCSYMYTVSQNSICQLQRAF